MNTVKSVSGSLQPKISLFQIFFSIFLSQHAPKISQTSFVLPDAGSTTVPLLLLYSGKCLISVNFCVKDAI